MSALRKVLVVDDDPVVGKSFDRVLSGKGYVVVTAENGQEALNRLGQEEYDLVFTDIKMPGMNGLEVAEQVRVRKPWVPVVIVTGYGTAEHETRAEAAGVSGFLHKPLSPELIEYSARKALQDTKAPTQDRESASEPASTPAAPQGDVASSGGRLKNIALFLAAPFIGLAYLLAFPFVGMGMLAVVAARAASGHRVLGPVVRFVKNVGLFVASPFIGLAYVLLFPFVGLAMLAWTGTKALANRAKAD